MLAGNADRERAVDVLRAAYAEGRLTKEEHDQRVGRALAARTIEELQHLSSDVPHGPGGVPSIAPPHRPQAYPQPYSRPRSHPSAYQGYGRRLPYPLRPPAPLPPPNGAAIGSLVCGILAPFSLGMTGVPAVILGHKARGEIRHTGERGDNWAVAGLALGWIGVCFVTLFTVLVIAG